MHRVAALALAVRLVQALAIRTAFAPDEYWQSIEVAHRLVFGYGHLTWEWAAGLRSYAHPLLFAAPYALLKALRLDSVWAVVRTPLLLQAVGAAGTDVYVWKLAALLLGKQAAGWCLVCQLASWFNAYCLVRTYSSCMEALLTTAGVYHWLCCCQPSSSGSGGSSRGKQPGSNRAVVEQGTQLQAAAVRPPNQRAWLACAALSVVFRPASALFWVLPAALQLWRRQRQRSRVMLLLDAATVGGGLLGAAALVDRMGYGRWVVVPWHFFKFNLLAGASAQYGGHPWHWNLSQGLPAVAASLLPLMATGLWLAGADKRLALLAAWSLLTYSLPAHKEFRFLLPALQLLMPYCGLAAARAFGSPAANIRPQASSGVQQKRQPHRAWRWGAAACILLQLPMATYFALFHQRAQVGVMDLIRYEAARQPDTTVLFLTPCHSTPYYTHVHQPLPMRFLDCSPHQHAAATSRLNDQEEAWLQLPTGCRHAAPGALLSQRQCFELNPAAYLTSVFEANPARQRPRLLVGFAPLMERLAGPLRPWGYNLHSSLNNCLVQTDDDSPCQLELWSL